MQKHISINIVNLFSFLIFMMGIMYIINRKESLFFPITLLAIGLYSSRPIMVFFFIFMMSMFDVVKLEKERIRNRELYNTDFDKELYNKIYWR